MKRVLYSSHVANLARQLRWASSNSFKTATKHDVATYVSSPSLCHDVLQRLAPSLQPHRGCDLIDVNPGTCLWSQHLHGVLKPRRHILIEPDRKTFDEFIMPLIEQDPTRFVHAATLAEALESSNGFLSDDIVKSGSAEPRAAINNRLLMTINTTRPVDPLVVDGSASGYFVNDFYTSFRGLRNNIHRYGLMRTLAWVSESNTPMLVPRTVEQRTRQSLLLEATSFSSEVAGIGWTQPSSQTDHGFHWPDLVSEAAGAIRKEELTSGIPTPATRRDVPPLPPLWALSADLESLKTVFREPHAIQQKDILELLELDKQLERKNPQWRREALSAQKRMRPASDPEQKRWQQLRKGRLLEHQRYLDVATLVKEQRDLEQRWRARLLLSGSDLSTQDARQLEAEAGRLKTKINSVRRAFLSIIKKAIDEYRAYDSRPQALAWNQRSSAPLTVHPQEFTPMHPLSLIDVVPRPEFRQLLQTEAQCDIFDYVVGTVWKLKPTFSLQDGLTALLSAGMEEFVDTCPSLRDPVQGGWYDLTELRMRSLPVKLYFDIALAWEKWPFRPHLSQTLPLRNKSISKFQDVDSIKGFRS